MDGDETLGITQAFKSLAKKGQQYLASSVTGPLPTPTAYPFNAGTAYDAVKYSRNRKTIATNNRSEDRLLKGSDRDKLISNARNLARNASIVAWARRRHLDNVATFTFQARTSIKELDQRIEFLIGDWWSRPLNCHAAGRHDLYKLIRLTESHKTTDGDLLVYKLTEGKWRGTIQLIEADRIRTPTDVKEYNATNSSRSVNVDDFTNGVKVDQYGKALAYAICDRSEITAGGYTLKEIVPASAVFLHGEFEREDQLRGISSLASGLNMFGDVYEAADAALAKMKLSQMFGVKFTRGPLSTGFDGVDGLEGLDATDPAHAAVLAATQKAEYDYDFGDGPQAIDLENGDDAEFMTVNTPSNEFQSFMEMGIMIGLKALDIPYSFFNESFTTYSGARQALLQYEQAAEQKRDQLRVLLHNLTVWRLSLFIADGVLVLPNKVDADGNDLGPMTMEDIKFKWVGAPLPWIDPLKEASANKIMVDNKLTSRQRICAANGQDIYEVMDELAAEEIYAKKIGLVLPETGADPALVNALLTQGEQPRGQAA